MENQIKVKVILNILNSITKSGYLVRTKKSQPRRNNYVGRHREMNFYYYNFITTIERHDRHEVAYILMKNLNTVQPVTSGLCLLYTSTLYSNIFYVQ